MLPTELKWIWRVTLRYNDTVKWPKRPGDTASQTLHSNDVSKDMEVAAAQKRDDVTIEVTRLR